MKNVPIPLPTYGVDLLSDLRAMQGGTVRVAENIDINKLGNFSRRSGFSTVVPGDDFHSVYADARGALVGKGENLYAMDDSYTPTLLTNMGEGPFDFTQYNGATYVLSRSAFRWFSAEDAVLRDVGVPLPATLPDLVAHPTGSLTAGEYAVALSRLDERGEESPTKLLGTIELTAGLQLTGLQLMPGSRYRVFLTPPNGDVLYLAAEFDAVFSQYVVGDTPSGAMRTSQHLGPMPAGDFVRGHAGRLYVARDDTLYFSEPLRPHLTDPRHSFIKFVGLIRFFEPVAAGIYVGDDRGVWWLPGMDPTAFELRKVAASVAVRRSSVLVPESSLPNEGMPQNLDSAVWLSTTGYAVGNAGGSVKALHPDKVALAADLEGRSVLVARDGITQVVTLIAATKEASQAFAVAFDSTLQ